MRSLSSRYPHHSNRAGLSSCIVPTSPRCEHTRTNGTRCGSPALRHDLILCAVLCLCGKKDDGDGVRHNRPAEARLITPTRNRRTPSCATLWSSPLAQLLAPMPAGSLAVTPPNFLAQYSLTAPSSSTSPAA